MGKFLESLEDSRNLIEGKTFSSGSSDPSCLGSLEGKQTPKHLITLPAPTGPERDDVVLTGAAVSQRLGLTPPAPSETIPGSSTAKLQLSHTAYALVSEAKSTTLP